MFNTSQTTSSSTPHDPVNAPSHYTVHKHQSIDVIEDWNLGFCLGNCIKYISRAPHKGNYLEDLKKAEWYLRRAIEEYERHLSSSSTRP